MRPPTHAPRSLTHPSSFTLLPALLLLLLLLSSSPSPSQALASPSAVTRIPRCLPAWQLRSPNDTALVVTASPLKDESRTRPRIQSVTTSSCSQWDEATSGYSGCASHGHLVIRGVGLCHPQPYWYPSPECRYWLGGRALLQHCNASSSAGEYFIDCQWDALTLAQLALPHRRPHLQQQQQQQQQHVVSMTTFIDSFSVCAQTHYLTPPDTSFARSTHSLRFNTLLPSPEIVSASGCQSSPVEDDETAFANDSRPHRYASGCTTDSVLTILTDRDMNTTSPHTRLILTAHSNDHRGIQQLFIDASRFLVRTARSITFALPFVDHAQPYWSGMRALRASVQVDVNDGLHAVSRRYAAVAFGSPGEPVITRVSSEVGDCEVGDVATLLECRDNATIYVHGLELTPQVRLGFMARQSQHTGLQCRYHNSTLAVCRLRLADAFLAESREHGQQQRRLYRMVGNDWSKTKDTGLSIGITSRIPLVTRVTGCPHNTARGTSGCIPGQHAITVHGVHFTTQPNLRMRLWLVSAYNGPFEYPMESELRSDGVFVFRLPPPHVFRFRAPAAYDVVYSIQSRFDDQYTAAPLHPQRFHAYEEQHGYVRITSQDRQRESSLRVYLAEGREGAADVPHISSVDSPSCRQVEGALVNCTWRHGDVELFITGRQMPSPPFEVIVGPLHEPVLCRQQETAQDGGGRVQHGHASVRCTLTCEAAMGLTERVELPLSIVPIRNASTSSSFPPPHVLDGEALHTVVMQRALSFSTGE